ncbi:phage tail protein [Salibacterium aidingense]|uniref:phage tail protein n=1 Tax=Salibacterium aidingense TaxID=384933 RepID=UPI003BDBA730
MIGEIRLFAGKYAPRNWAFCNGQSLPITQYASLFNVIGTTYGGDGRQEFRLPDLRDRVSLHAGSGTNVTPRTLGERGGASTAVLTSRELPYHNHLIRCSKGNSDSTEAVNHVWADAGGFSPDKYTTKTPDTPMKEDALAEAGGREPHNNRQPFLGLHYIIALVEERPSHS